MGKTFIFHNATLYGKDRKIENPFLTIENGKIVELGEANNEIYNDEVEEVHFHDPVKIVPGFIDVHIHGAENADVMDGTDGALTTMKQVLPKEGTTSFLATTLTQSPENKLKALEVARSHIENDNVQGAEVIGVHLEGPFICEKRAGAQPKEHIRKADIALFQQFQEASGGHIRLVTFAPEEDEVRFVNYLNDTNVIPSIGHSDATYDQVASAIKNGVRHATHLFNGMRGIHHRDPGVAGGSLLHNEVIVEMIVDGIHIAEPMVKFAYEHKGADGIILITDSMRAKGLDEGTYELGGQNVFVENGQATLEDGTLAGSILTMNEALKNMVQFSGCSFEEAIQMATYNPAKQLGIEDCKGSLNIGYDADFTILDDQFDVKQTYVSGTKVFSCIKEG
ncbi:N-acetylglucosamine-6-phosphate deacetylase [Bacillus shivajii]|uniref:N-acetylglucosamine-6-phosphate deacetylase n=1 Tax=Bacillus shivajii TaxID=1983719 RepID=UPI001CFB5735|nr:N-acetylglucosamine-6-phosphate deacetylase [Bacillus shivajii]UCZ53638.1 N-acetylglucosamine-6-phosphate deacetylase [Bacillus shivajii]